MTCLYAVIVAASLAAGSQESPLCEYGDLLVGDWLGEASVFEMPAPVMGAEDFSYVAAEVPAVMAFLGVCPPDNADPFHAPACHSNRMVLHEDSMATGVALHVAVASALLDDPPDFVGGSGS